MNNKITPPGKKIAFNQALQLNDGLLAKYVSEKEGIGYEEALDKIHHLLVALRQQLFETRTVHLEKVGTFYMDMDEVTTFHPEADLNVSKENFGLITLSAIPVQRAQDDRLKLKIKTRVDQRSKDLKHRSAPIFAKIAVAAACLIIGIGIWSYLEVPQVRSFAASMSLSNNSSPEQPSTTSATAKHIYPINANQMQTIIVAEKELKGDTTWSVLLGGFSSIAEARNCIDDLTAQGIQAGFSIQDQGKTWVYLTKTGSRELAEKCVNGLKPTYADSRIIGLRNR
jgi:hypothetical protein